ncbi:ParB/RepB/Spo0J family partition protein [Candidatus Parcubacteria bacterium]|nr:ParB/RepB/Spo0J family partition protein [Candidatus Parcubacteria bacterium]
MNKPALGRGLGSLIPQKQSLTAQVIPEARQEVRDLDVSAIKENPRQPRAHFSPSELEDLIASIEEHGIIQPLVVTRQGDGYELIAGERRLRAARTLGLKTVPAMVRDASEQQKLELALIENIQRQDLNAVEEAVAYRALIDEFNLTQEQVSKRVGKSRSNVANILRLLELPDTILAALRDGRISKSHGRTLLSEEDPQKQMELFKRMLTGEVSVHEAEARVRPNASTAKPQKDPNLAAHEKRLREVWGTKVDITASGGKGKIVISFYSREELLDLLDRLSGQGS